MARTFLADCIIVPKSNESPGYNVDSATYIAKQWGVRLWDYNEEGIKQLGALVKNILRITVRDYPEIMSDLEQTGYFDTQPPVWQVNRISEQGITLYLVNNGGVSDDGKHDLWEEVFIFIPMGNVIAIHNVSEQFFINESVNSMERKL